MLTIKSDRSIVGIAKFENPGGCKFAILLYGETKELVDWAIEYIATGLQFGPQVLIFLLGRVKEQGIEAIFTLEDCVYDKENVDESTNI